VNAQGKQRDGGWAPRGARWLLAVAGCCALAGCADFWQEVTTGNFNLSERLHPPDPLWVIRNSPDGDKRAQALRSLREPLAHGGTQQEQDVVVSVLVHGAGSDPQALCRLAAIDALQRFGDPRAVKGLEDAYYHAGRFGPEVATVIRCQALLALGETQDPKAIPTLVRALRQPPVEGPDDDKQQKMDERISAARALGRFQHYDAARALIDVLRTEQDVALRDRVNDSLVAATGQHLAAEASAWDDYFRRTGPSDRSFAREPGVGERVLNLVGWFTGQ
jgi:hypothetical protein